MPQAGFEPTIWAGERPQTYALDRAATGTGTIIYISHIKYMLHWRIFSRIIVMLSYVGSESRVEEQL